MNQETETIEPEVIPQEPQETSLATIPETVTELAPLGDRGKAIIEARRQIIDTAVRASIWLTMPEDWLLFRDVKTGREIAFLQDSGCKRVLPIWGIQITPKGFPLFEKTESGGDYAYTIRGDAYSKLTDTSIFDVEGVRCSTERFIEQVSEPLLKEVRVKQAARANLDGNCVRRLSGLQNVPKATLDEVWRGTGKTSARCAQGKGYGTQAERQGAAVQQATDVPTGQEPTCEICNRKMSFVPAGTTRSGKDYKAFWSCPDGGEGKKHVKCTMSHEDVLKKIQADREPGAEG